MSEEIKTVEQALSEVGYRLDLADCEGLMSPAVLELKAAVESLYLAVCFMKRGEPST